MHVAQEWVAMAEKVVDVLMRLAGVLLACGFAWHALHVIVDYTVGNGRSVAQVCFSALGLVAGFLLVVFAPSIASSLAPIFIQPLIR